MRKHNLKLVSEVMGLSPLGLRLKQAGITLFGEEDVPRSKFGLSSLKQLYPKISPTLWKGKPYLEKTVILSNLFNHTQTPIEEGWSVQKTQTRDFRGRGLTYNSHNGTDLAIPVGSTVCTAAAGEVVAIKSEFNRGGLKIFIDHGEGLMTCYAHLARPLVKVGDVLHRGQPIALSGYSGIDAVISYPFGIPHVHFNVWLNGEPIDPFPFADETRLWRSGKLPTPATSFESDFVPSTYVEQHVETAIGICKTEKSRRAISEHTELKFKAANLIIEMNYYPTRFPKRINVYDKKHERAPRLDLPFLKEEFEQVVFLDDLLQMKD